jgi:hypothetical protein
VTSRARAARRRRRRQVLNKADRVELNACSSVAATVDLLRRRGLALAPSPRLLPLAGPAHGPPSRRSSG